MIKMHVLKPLPAEYLQRLSRPQPLEVQAFAGCITTVDEDLLKNNPNIWAVVGIEIIEHLHPDVLRGFEETVFGIFSPDLVIVTTPNAEFNEVFNLPPGKFRHWDHKFEWTRQEFCQWCEKVVKEFQSYTYRTEGICEGSEETRHLGCVSQMAIFEKATVQQSNEQLFPHRIRKDAYTLVQSLEYPNFKETRTPEEITLCELNYYISTFVLSRSMRDQYDESGMTQVKLPLSQLQTISALPKVAIEDVTFFIDVIKKAGYQIEGDEEGQMSVIISLDDLSSESNSLMDDEEYLCDGVVYMNVNRVPPVEDEDNWEL
ncbi:Small RNA 2'-O-methyltransferase [Orchesella cincta]|uniref:Small RNA 2'-O-methyltransferase n=1 Tax=Orchesella cincta TaxID=48709 RepID=A0A1D2NFG8_ORCCI|nr:Small RNA 2'-O-methyltransferase [Orchesella cincta]